MNLTINIFIEKDTENIQTECKNDINLFRRPTGGKKFTTEEEISWLV